MRKKLRNSRRRSRARRRKSRRSRRSRRKRKTRRKRTRGRRRSRRRTTGTGTGTNTGGTAGSTGANINGPPPERKTTCPYQCKGLKSRHGACGYTSTGKALFSYTVYVRDNGKLKPASRCATIGQIKSWCKQKKRRTGGISQQIVYNSDCTRTYRRYWRKDNKTWREKAIGFDCDSFCLPANAKPGDRQRFKNRLPVPPQRRSTSAMRANPSLNPAPSASTQKRSKSAPGTTNTGNTRNMFDFSQDGLLNTGDNVLFGN